MQPLPSAVSLLALSLSVSAALTVAAHAQDGASPVADPETSAGDEIVVRATRIRGSVDTGQPPLATLDESDIAALGTGSLQELLAAIAPQAGSGRGRGDGQPVVLLNGLRISGFRELRNFPPEAIRKVEVLPEEVALKYGYRPNQRVVNFILKDKFKAFTLDAEGRLPGGGGFSEQELEATLASITTGARLNISGKLTDTSPLTEAERGLVQPATGAPVVAGDPAPGQYRTLIDDGRSAALNLTWARGFGPGSSLSLNGAVEKKNARSLFGLDGAILTEPDGSAFYRTTLQGGALARDVETITAQAGTALNRPLGAWMLSATADYSHVSTDSTVDRRADFAGLQALVSAGLLAADGPLPALVLPMPDTARSNTDNAAGLVTLVGQPVRLPGGEVSLTGKAGYAWSSIDSTDSRNPGLATRLRRGNTSAGFSMDVPLTSRREGFGAGIGDLSVNVNADVNDLSDFGTLWGYGAGLTWSPVEKLSLQASYIASEAAPGLADLGAPTLVTPGVSLYDFVRGETVLASVTTGGNPLLAREKQRDLKFAVNWELPWLKNSNFVAEYFRNRSYDTTNAFPLLTPAIEAAFPGRVTRDAAGRLVAIDQRPVTFAQEDGQRLRYGVNLGGSLGTPDPNARRSPMAGMARGGGMGPGGGDGRGRWNLAVYHTVRFEESVRITKDGPVLDLLNGDAVAGGGSARHAIELEGGAFYRGFGLRMNGTYTGGSRINGSGLPGAGAITFAPVARLDVRLFADLGRMDSVTKAVPFFKGARIALQIENLFDAQQRVRDGAGAVPLRYQPGYLDPRGRVFELDFRKQF